MYKRQCDILGQVGGQLSLNSALLGADGAAGQALGGGVGIEVLGADQDGLALHKMCISDRWWAASALLFGTMWWSTA